MIRDIANAAATRVLLIAAGVLSSLITVRLLGAEGRGIYFYWLTLAALVVQFGNFGLPSSNTYYLARDRSLLAPLAANALVCALAVGVLAVGVAGSAGTLWGLPFEPSWLTLASTAVLAAGSMYFLLAVNLLAALKRYSEFNLFDLLQRYLGVAGVGVGALFWRSPEAAVTGAAVASVIAAQPLHRRLRQLGAAGGRPDARLFRSGFGFAARAYLVMLLGFLVLRLNAFLLAERAGPEALGEWSIAAQLLDTIGLFPAAVAVVLYPAILTSGTPYDQMRRHLGPTALTMLGLCGAAALFGRPVIVLLYGPEHEIAYDLLLYGLPGAFCVGLLAVIMQFLAAMGQPPAMIAIWIVGVAVELSLSLHLLPDMGAAGAMIALSAGHATILLLAWTLAWRLRARTPSPVPVVKGPAADDLPLPAPPDRGR